MMGLRAAIVKGLSTCETMHVHACYCVMIITIASLLSISFSIYYVCKKIASEVYIDFVPALFLAHSETTCIFFPLMHKNIKSFACTCIANK